VFGISFYVLPSRPIETIKGGFIEIPRYEVIGVIPYSIAIGIARFCLIQRELISRVENTVPVIVCVCVITNEITVRV
jgi:hypothetical protein